MEQKLSVEVFLRFVKEKHKQFINSLDTLLNVLVEDNKESKEKSAERCLELAKNLRNNLSNSDSPGWLNESINFLDWYLNNINGNGVNHALIKRIVLIYNQIISHEWFFNESQDVLAFDFDAIYNECKKESRIDELFEKIISYLQEIINSKEIDSIKVISTLERIIATLKKHNTASYFSLHSMWDFLAQLMKNVMWEQLEEVPTVKPIVKGLRKTFEETGIEFSDLIQHMKDVMKHKFNSDFLFLNQGSNNLLD